MTFLSGFFCGLTLVGLLASQSVLEARKAKSDCRKLRQEYEEDQRVYTNTILSTYQACGVLMEALKRKARS